MLKKSIISLLFLLGLSFPAFAEKKIAVLPFDVPSDKVELKQFGTGTSDTITMALTNIKEFIMIDRSRTENILKEQAFQKSGFVEQENAIKLGKLLGAEILVAGSIQYSAGNYRLTARLTDVETGKVLKSVQVTGNDIFDLQDKIAIEIIKANNIKIENNTNNQPITNNENNSFTIATKTESISLFDRVKKVFKATANISAYNYYNSARDYFLVGKEKDLKKAIYYYGQALEEDPKYVLALVGKAQAQAYLASDYEIQGKPYKEFLDQASENIKIALEKDTQISDTYKTLSLISKLKGNFEEGKNYAKKALELSPNDSESYYLLWANEPNPKNNDPTILKAVEINPYIVKRTVSIAYSYFKQSKFSESINLYKQAINLYPDYYLPYTGLGYTYYYINDFNNAEINFNKALEINSKDGVAYSGLGLISFKKGNSQKAEKLLLKGIKISPEHSITHTSLGFFYYLTGEKEEALKEFSQALQINPEDFYARDAIGLYYFEKGDINTALEHYNASLMINPLGIAANYNIGNLYKYWGKNKEAMDKFQECLKIFPDFIPAISKLAEMYEISGNINYSAAYYKKASELEPTSYNFNKAGLSFYQLKKYNEAEFYYKKSLQLNNKDIFTQNNLGIVYYSQGKIDEALAQYKTVLDFNPNDLNAMENIAIAYQKKGLISESIYYYKKTCIMGGARACDFIDKLETKK